VLQVVLAAHVCESVEEQTVTGTLRRNASLRAIANALTRLLLAAVVRLFPANCRSVGVAMAARIATMATAVSSSTSVNPCWVFLMGAQSEGVLRAPARPSDQWLTPADQRFRVVNWITVAGSLNEGRAMNAAKVWGDASPPCRRRAGGPKSQRD
jgi:hypothetical protein